MCYNVLSQDLLETHRQLYNDCDPFHLRWEQRRERILNEIVIEQPDVLCMQEANWEHYHSFYLPSLKQYGYDGVYKKRKGDKKDGCATFYKTKSFRLEQNVEVEYDRPEINSILDRENVAQICILCPLVANAKMKKAPANRIVIANTHLLFNPKRGDIKLGQLRLLLAELQRIVREQPNYDKFGQVTCAFLCGDLNLLPDSYLFRFIESGSMQLNDKLSGAELSGQMLNYSNGALKSDSLQMTGIDKHGRWTDETSSSNSPEHAVSKDSNSDSSANKMTIRHPFKFRSAYASKNKTGSDFMSTQSSRRYGIVDYIFYTQNTELQLLSLRKMLTIPQFLNSVRAIPDQDFGSDHFSLVTRFALKIKT